MRTNAITSDDFLVFFNILLASFQKSNIEKLTDFLFIFSGKKFDCELQLVTLIQTDLNGSAC